MKKPIISLLIVLSTIMAFGQNRVYGLKDTIEGNTMQDLDSLYKNGLPINDTINPLFSHGYFDSIVLQERNKFLKKLRGHLIKNEFLSDAEIMIWTRMYMDENGKVDYFLYRFISPVDRTKEKVFRILVNEVLAENTLDVSSPVKFSICGRVLLKGE